MNPNNYYRNFIKLKKLKSWNLPNLKIQLSNI